MSEMRGSAVFDGDAVWKIEGIVDVEGGQVRAWLPVKLINNNKSPSSGGILIIAVRGPL